MKLSATVAWNYPSVRELAAHVLSLCALEGVSAASVAPHVEHSDIGQLSSDVDELSDYEALAELMGGTAR